MVDRYDTGLIVGRFDPPHLGHSHLIERAHSRTDRLVVFVNTRVDRDAAPGALRAQWLQQLHPEVVVVEVRHELDTDWADEALWARWMALFRAHWPHETGPDAVFSSDGYVSPLADRFEAVAVSVDPDRSTVPVSATMVRTDPSAHLHRLAPPVRAWVEANWV
jgi:HTH-type transcriptional regulator, transcriptional repressor of NAD biosynthesis genes